MWRRDDADFAAFAEAHGNRMRRTAYLMCGDWERAADLVQEALIKLYVAWPRIDRADGLPGYARRTVISVAVDAARKRSSREAPHGTVEPSAVPDSTGGVNERMVLIQALGELAPRQRACVVLRYYEDLSVEATASALGCSQGTVKSQTARGLDTLRLAYRRLGGDLRIDDIAPTEAKSW